MFFPALLLPASLFAIIVAVSIGASRMFSPSTRRMTASNMGTARSPRCSCGMRHFPSFQWCDATSAIESALSAFGSASFEQVQTGAGIRASAGLAPSADLPRYRAELNARIRNVESGLCPDCEHFEHYPLGCYESAARER